MSKSLGDELGNLKTKTLILWGKDDHGTSLEQALLLFQKIPQAELHVFDQCAHWVQWDQAERFNNLVAEFLKAENASSLDDRPRTSPSILTERKAMKKSHRVILVGIVLGLLSLSNAFSQEKKVEKFRAGGGSASATQMSLWLA